MNPRGGRRGRKPEQPLGSAAFGTDPKGRAVGSGAFGGADPKLPLRGALLFGNDPEGRPRGSEAFGGPDQKLPLRGALLFGNDPQGSPRGSEAVGGAEPAVPLKGALLFGNDPQGQPRGSEAFGNADRLFRYRGAAAIGAPQQVPERLFKDEVGYDFVGVMLHMDDTSLAGIRKDPRDRERERVLQVLKRRLGVEAEKLRHGLNESSIPWGRLRREPELDRALAEELRALYRRAPGEVLGIGHVRDLLERTERMHTFVIECDWDRDPVDLRILLRGTQVATAATTFHKEHTFFTFKDPAGKTLAYSDNLVPGQRAQQARIRAVDGELVAIFELQAPSPDDWAPVDKPFDLRACVRNETGREVFGLREERVSPQSFLACLTDPVTHDAVGRIEDKLAVGRIRTHIELDLAVPRVIAWTTAAIMADLARLRRRGWPQKPETAGTESPPLEGIERALGPRRRRR